MKNVFYSTKGLKTSTIKLLTPFWLTFLVSLMNNVFAQHFVTLNLS